MRIALVVTSILLFLALAAVATLRAITIQSTPLHRGGVVMSPDGDYMATVEGVFWETFLGQKYKKYRFAIFPKKSNYPDGTNYEWSLTPISEIWIDNPIGEEHRMPRGRTPFPCQWSSDSRLFEVDVFQNTVTLRPQKAEQGAAANP